ncbi:hypothetical protein EI94DRAFT_1700152 [Lactarius quietus]|nr:hypothetical protein EI94DRAFT_1700152 [Lactarius quietus]
MTMPRLGPPSRRRKGRRIQVWASLELPRVWLGPAQRHSFYFLGALRLVHLHSKCARFRRLALRPFVCHSTFLPFAIPTIQLALRWPLANDLSWTIAPEPSIADIDRNIAVLQNSLSLYPRSHPEHIDYIYGLAELRWERYQLSQEKEDLDNFLVHCTKAVFLPPISRNGPSLNNIFQLHFFLALALLELSKVFEQNEGLKYSIEYLRYLRGLPLEPFDVPRNLVTISLIQALGTQVESEDEDGTQSIKEMVVLCRELLTSNLEADIPTAAFRLNTAALAEFKRGHPIEFLDEVIECLRDAVKVRPQRSESYPILLALALQLQNRFITTHSLDDYEEGTAQLEKILDPNQPGECPDSIRGLASVFSTQFAVNRCAIFLTPEYSEVAISRLRALLSSSSLGELARVQYTETLSMLVRERFRTYSLSESLDEANSNLSQVVRFSSSQSLEKSDILLSETDDVRKTYSTTMLQQKIQHLEELLSNTPPGTERYQECLSDLADWYESKFNRTDDIADIEESIKYSRLSLDATRASDPWRYIPLTVLRDNLFLAFEKTRKISYLDESISLSYDILESKTAQDGYCPEIETIVQSLLDREKLLGRIEDRHEAIRIISVVINDQYAPEPDRFLFACWWANLARRISHPTTLTAYKTAMSLMQKSLSFAPTVSVQHAHLVTMGENCQTMPLEYASYQIDLGQIEEAVETLEQGRALLWSEMRGLRNPVVQLIEEDTSLAKRFAEINQELEALTISVTPSGRPDLEDGDAQGLEGLLKTPAFATLRSAASRGPIIIINHCAWRSDVVIIFHESLPCSIPTDTDFYDRANKLRDDLVEARKRDGLDSKEYQDALCSVLRGLYELVGEPVIKRLRLLGVPEQSRIWWCPTSVFCSLPLHAMGPIPSSEARKQYFSDLYIPSYTPSSLPSLSLEMETAGTGVPSLLLVAQPEDSLAGVTENQGHIERALKAGVRSRVLSQVRPLPPPYSRPPRQSTCSFRMPWRAGAGKPFDASFKLHGGSPLTLLDIVRSRLPDAEFAFLSCCHAAEITEESVADEALHLTAAMQYCGFRSVVGTMWEMADTDGKDLAKNFYESLFSSQESGVPYYERSAGALRDATKKLREKRGINLERWVNFVHYGA